MNVRKNILIIAIFLGMTQSIDCFFPINLFKPYDMNILPEPAFGKKWQFTIGYEGGFNFRGYAQDENEEFDTFCRAMNVLQLYQIEQDALAMFKGFPQGSCLELFSQQFNVDDDDGRRGHLIPTGKLDVPANLMFSARYYAPYNINFTVFLPYYVIRLHDVCWQDLTDTVRAEDLRVRTLLTDNFVANVARLTGLQLTGWERSGIGDLTFMGQWLENFPQPKPLLKNVQLNVRVSISAPTGKKTDEDLLFAFPFGNDGGVAIIPAIGLDLRFGQCFRVGGDIQLMHIFDSIKERRIKTNLAQTDLLFAAKIKTLKEFGWTQEFNLYARLWQFYKGLSLRVDYQYIKHFDDKLWLYSENFDPIVANTAESLLESTMHGVILNATYDFNYDSSCVFGSPYINIFGKVGFNGKRAILGNTFGAIISFSF